MNRLSVHGFWMPLCGKKCFLSPNGFFLAAVPRVVIGGENFCALYYQSGIQSQYWNSASFLLSRRSASPTCTMLCCLLCQRPSPPGGSDRVGRPDAPTFIRGVVFHLHMKTSLPAPFSRGLSSCSAAKTGAEINGRWRLLCHRCGACAHT